jgi:hypothetical protein
VPGDLPAVLARQRAQQPAQARGGTAAQIRPREHLAGLHQQLLQPVAELLGPLLVGDDRREVQQLRPHIGPLPAPHDHRTTAAGSIYN